MLRAIHFYKEKQDNNPVLDQLPFNVLFTDSLESAHNKIGVEEFESGGGEEVPILGRINLWRRYPLGPYYLRVELSQDNVIAMITIGLDKL